MMTKQGTLIEVLSGIAIVLSCVALPSHAVRAVGAAAPSPESVRSVHHATPLAQADDRSSLRQGVVTALGQQNHWVHVNGTWMAVVEGRTRLFRHGKPVAAEVLAKGQLLRFTLAPGRDDGTTLGVVYVP